MGRLRIRSESRGTMLVEAALIIPLLIFLTFALVEYGWIFVKLQQINNAARQGARLGVVAGASNASVTAAIDLFFTEAGIGNYTVAFSPGDIAAVPAGETFTVTVMVPYAGADLQLVGLPLIPVPQDLQGSVSMAKEGP